jgi:hypothetical protein
MSVVEGAADGVSGGPTAGAGVAAVAGLVGLDAATSSRSRAFGGRRAEVGATIVL